MQRTDVEYLEVLTRQSTAEANAELEFDLTSGGGWCSEVASKLRQYDKMDLWENDLSKVTFSKAISESVLSYHSKQDMVMLQSSSQGALLRRVFQLFPDRAGPDIYRSPHPVLGQLDAIKQPGRSALLRFIVGAYFQNIRKDNRLVTGQCPLCEEKWQTPTIHLFGKCMDPTIYTARQLWLKDGGIYTPNEWSYKYLAGSLGVGSNPLAHRLFGSAKLHFRSAMPSLRLQETLLSHQTATRLTCRTPNQELQVAHWLSEEYQQWENRLL